MQKKKILVVFGTRPEVIKMAPVIKELQKHPGKIKLHICATAQHREMLDQMLQTFAIQPDIDLGLMTADQSPSQVASEVFRQLPPVIRQTQAEYVLVQGDTTTAAAAALCAFYEGCKIGHVEAGLRTQRQREPFPEEMNRRLASTVADFHFAPTALSRQNLLDCGVPEDRIMITGNTVIDALQWIAGLPAPPAAQLYLELDSPDQKLVLITAHRRENIGLPLNNLCDAICELTDTFGKQLRILFPVHLNPRVREIVTSRLEGQPGVQLLPPLDYRTFVCLMQNSAFLLTDSGGVQEEATAFGKPVLVIRNVSDRPEAIKAGGALLVGTESASIVAAVSRLMKDSTFYQSMSQATSPYGDGKAAEKIVELILRLPPTA